MNARFDALGGFDALLDAQGGFDALLDAQGGFDDARGVAQGYAVISSLENRLSPLAYVFLGLIHLYRSTLGVVLPKACRFEPSCSTYALEAVARHGAIRGGWLSFWRVARCNPLNRGGLDPVPPVLGRGR